VGTPEDVDRVHDDFVFPYVDRTTSWRRSASGCGRIAARYLRQLHHVLDPGGRALVHTSNLRTPGGWERFASQPAPTIRGFFFVTPETVDLLAEKAGFVVDRRSALDLSNFYYRRDYLALLRKDQAGTR